MAFSETVRRAMEAQIGHEFGAANTYLSMAGYFDAENLPGFADWMRSQSQEEMTHGMKFCEYLLDREVQPEIPAVPKPAHEFESVIHVFQLALEHEKGVTRQIYDIYELALAEKDYASQNLLQWFIDEQMEEEKTASGILERAKMVEGSRSELLMLDSELGTRTGAPA